MAERKAVMAPATVSEFTEEATPQDFLRIDYRLTYENMEVEGCIAFEDAPTEEEIEALVHLQTHQLGAVKIKIEFPGE